MKDEKGYPIKICSNPNCRKEFTTYKHKRKGHHFVLRRSWNAKTCSSKCSKEYCKQTIKDYQAKLRKKRKIYKQQQLQ